MSTAEIGLSLAEMIRGGKVHAVSCTGANIEEDVFNLIAHNHYRDVSGYRTFGPADDAAMLAADFNRVTDTCLPDKIIWDRLERPLMDAWQTADRNRERLFPQEFLFRLLKSGVLERHYEIDPRDSWVLAAMDMNVPVFVPAWEDSSLGNMYTAACMRRDIIHADTVRGGVDTLVAIANWYTETASQSRVGFFQVGGGVSGDFAICVVPMLRTDLSQHSLPRWQYYCQISDSTTSYGSYSGATPSEKVSWGKLDTDTPAYMIESDATLVVPLIFAYVLGW